MAIYSKKTKSKINLDKKVKRNIGITLIVIFGLLLINLIFGILSLFNSVMLGTFGLLTYAIYVCIIGFGVMLILDKSITANKIDVILFVLFLFFFICLLQCATSTMLPTSSYGKYLVGAYNYKYTAGGILFSIFTYPILSLTHTFVASIVIFAIALIIVTTLIIINLYDRFQITKIHPVEEDVVNEKPKSNYENQLDIKPNNTQNKELAEESIDNDIFVEDEEIERLEKENKITELTTTEKDKIKAKNILGLSKEEEPQPQKGKNTLRDIFRATETSNFNDNNNSYEYEGGRPPRFVHEEKNSSNSSQKSKKPLSDNDKKNLEYLRVITGRPIQDEVETNTSTVTPSEYKPNFDTSSNFENQSDTKSNYFNNASSNPPLDLNEDLYDENLTYSDVKNNNYNANAYSSNTPNLGSQDISNNFPNNTNQEYNKPKEVIEEESVPSYSTSQTFKKPPIIKEELVEEVDLTPIQKEPAKMAQMVMNEVATEKNINQPKYKKPYHYTPPPIDLLNIVHNQASDDDENIVKGQMLEDTLASFKAPAKIVSIKRGPAFSRFEMQMPTGVPVNKIINYSNDIAMAVQSNGAIRMEIPIPGKSTFGIEVPNKHIDMVGIRDVIESENFRTSSSPLTFALGKDIAGDAKIAQLDKLIHLLVAGATGSGKSVCLNTMLISFLYNASPEDVKLILVDPKQVEFNFYKGIPHLLIPDIITDPDKAVMMLEWACGEMERRYKLLSSIGARNISDYNKKDEVKDGLFEKMPYIVIILDEVGDLMLTHKKEIEDKIVRLGQLARAAGIHMVIATQRPSVDIITGTIKANLPSRIAFAVTSFENSKTIIGCSGAENLLGRGDMLLSDQASPDLKRIQGAYVSDTEIENVVKFVKENNECVFDSEIEDAMFNPKNNSFSADSPREEAYDPMLKDAVRIVMRSNRATISNVQRTLGVGFPKAGKLIDQMEKAGFISEPDSKNNRVIFITPQEFEERFGEDY